jgi:kinesin family member 15
MFESQLQQTLFNLWFIFQVVIRVRPLNNNEKNLHSYYRCLKQESAQTITWIGQPETRFTFDHVACEAVDQVC